MARSVFCIVHNRAQAETIVDQLKASGFSNTDISVLFPDKTGSRDFAHEKHTKAPEGAVAGGATGMALGGVLGWLAGIGTPCGLPRQHRPTTRHGKRAIASCAG